MFKRGELVEKYIKKILFGWNGRKFKDEYLKKLERSYVRRLSALSKINSVVLSSSSY